MRTQTILLATLAGCFSPDVTVCGNDVCPVSLVCDPAHDRCVNAGQVEECSTRGEGEACEFQNVGGFCDQGVCYAAICGDEITIKPELCDDGNTVSDDGCSADCRSTERCGNGVVDADRGEQCDCGDGTVDLPTGCLLANSDDPLGECRENCLLQCGDGEVDSAEACDGYDSMTSCMDFGFDRGPAECENTCTLDLRGCRSLGWQPEYLPTDIDLITAIWAMDGELFVVGFEVSTGGRLAHFDGLEWNIVEVPEQLLAVWGRSTSEVYAVGGAAVYRFDGADWNKEYTGLLTDRHITSVWGDETTTLIGVGAPPADKKDVIYSRQPGPIWVEDWQSEFYAGIYQLGGNSDTGFIAGGTYNTNLGPVPMTVRRIGPGEWEEFGDTERLDTRPAALTAIGGEVLVGDGNAVKRYNSNTNTWDVVTIADYDVSGLTGPSLDDLFVATQTAFIGATYHFDGVALINTDDRGSLAVTTGTDGRIISAFVNHLGTWPGSGFGPGIRLLDAFVIDIESLWVYDRTYAVGVGRGVIATLSGSTRSQEPVSLALLRTVWGRSPTEVYAAGGGGVDQIPSKILRFDGDTWDDFTPLPQSLPSAIMTLHGDASRLIAGGTSGWLWEYSQETWIDHSLPVDSPVTDAWTGNGEIFAVAGGDLWRWKDGAWSRVVLSGRLNSLWGTGPTDIYAVGDGGEVWRFAGDSSTPMLSPTLSNLTFVRGTSSNDIFAIGPGNEVVHFDGVRWAPVRGPGAATRSLAVSPTDVIIGNSFGNVTRLIRTQPWTTSP